MGYFLLKEFFKANKDIKIFYLDAYFDNKHYKSKQDEKKGINRLIKFYQKHGFKTILPPPASPYENVPMFLLTK